MDNETAFIVALIGLCYLIPLNYLRKKITNDHHPRLIAVGKKRKGLVIRFGALLFLIGAFCAVLMTYQGLHLVIATPYYQDMWIHFYHGEGQLALESPSSINSPKGLFSEYILFPIFWFLMAVSLFSFPFLCIFLGVFSLGLGQKYIKDAVKVVMGK